MGRAMSVPARRRRPDGHVVNRTCKTRTRLIWHPRESQNLRRAGAQTSHISRVQWVTMSRGFEQETSMNDTSNPGATRVSGARSGSLTPAAALKRHVEWLEFALAAARSEETYRSGRLEKAT